MNAKVHAGDGPTVVADVGLINLEVAALVKMAENAPSEAHLFKKRAIDSGDVLFLRIHQHHSLHADQDLFHMRWRVVAGIGTKLEPQKAVTGFPHAGPAAFSAIVFI